jgi:hypothetical protein
MPATPGNPEFGRAPEYALSCNPGRAIRHDYIDRPIVGDRRDRAGCEGPCWRYSEAFASFRAIDASGAASGSLHSGFRRPRAAPERPCAILLSRSGPVFAI